MGLYSTKKRPSAFLPDLRIPFENSQVEKGIKIMKLQQKIQGIFRTTHIEVASCRIRAYVSTIRKHGLLVMDVIIAVLKGDKLMIL
jgi:transposase